MKLSRNIISFTTPAPAPLPPPDYPCHCHQQSQRPVAHQAIHLQLILNMHKTKSNSLLNLMIILHAPHLWTDFPKKQPHHPQST